MSSSSTTAVMAAAGLLLTVLVAWAVLVYVPSASGPDGASVVQSGELAAAPAAPSASASPRSNAPGVPVVRDGSIPGLVVIGDTFTSGVDGDPAGSWPELVCQQAGCQYLPSYASPGTGYTTPGADGLTVDQRIDAVVAAQPEIVVFAAGAFDTGADPARVRGAVNQAFYRLHRLLPTTRLIALSPFTATQPATDAALEVRSAVYAASLKHGIPFTNVTDLDMGAAAGQEQAAGIVLGFVQAAIAAGPV